MSSWFIWLGIFIVSTIVLRMQFEHRYFNGKGRTRPKRSADWRIIAVSLVVSGGSLYRVTLPITSWVHLHAHAIVVTLVVGLILSVGICLGYVGFRRNNPHLFERE